MNTIEGLTIHPDGRVVDTQFDSLADYQAAIGGYIEAIGLEGAVMLVDEDGRFKRGAVENPLATAVAAMCGRRDLADQGLVGPVVLVGPSDGDHWVSLPASLVALVNEVSLQLALIHGYWEGVKP